MANAYADAIWAAVAPDATPERFEQRRAFLLDNVSAGDTVLDLGCGTGEFSAALAGAGAVPIGVDVAAEALRRAAERTPGLDLRLWSDGDPLPLPTAPSTPSGPARSSSTSSMSRRGCRRCAACCARVAGCC